MIHTLILTRSEIATLLTHAEVIEAVREAFLAHGDGSAKTPSILGVNAERGGFHVKAGVMKLRRNYFVSKTNANFPLNPKDYRLPTIQGVITVSDADNGRLLALIDSTEITTLRTGAATAVAAHYLSNQNASTVTIFGCGIQGRISLRMLQQVRPIKQVWIYDLDPEVATDFAASMQKELNLHVTIGKNPAQSLSHSEICVTCTPSKVPFLKRVWIKPGTFIAAVGADNEEKHELDVSIMKSAKIVTDITSQCAAIGELHHALNEDVISKENVYAELGEIVAGRKPGRISEEDIIVFDSTGMALQDITSTVKAYERAVEQSIGLSVNLMG